MPGPEYKDVEFPFIEQLNGMEPKGSSPENAKNQHVALFEKRRRPVGQPLTNLAPGPQRHAMNRGAQRTAIVEDDADRACFEAVITVIKSGRVLDILNGFGCKEVRTPPFPSTMNGAANRIVRSPLLRATELGGRA